ncbi:MAG: hypothetical protein ACK5JF_12330 [Oscillospiraceae bacterium]
MSVLQSIGFALCLMLVVFIVLASLMLVTMLVGAVVRRIEKNKSK